MERLSLHDHDRHEHDHEGGFGNGCQDSILRRGSRHRPPRIRRLSSLRPVLAFTAVVGPARPVRPCANISTLCSRCRSRGVERELRLELGLSAQGCRSHGVPVLPAYRGPLLAPVPELELNHAWGAGERQVGHVRAVQAVLVKAETELAHITPAPLASPLMQTHRPQAETVCACRQALFRQRPQTLTSGVGRGIRCPQRGIEHVPFATRTAMFAFFPLSALIVVSSFPGTVGYPYRSVGQAWHVRPGCNMHSRSP